MAAVAAQGGNAKRVPIFPSLWPVALLLGEVQRCNCNGTIKSCDRENPPSPPTPLWRILGAASIVAGGDGGWKAIIKVSYGSSSSDGGGGGDSSNSSSSSSSSSLVRAVVE